MHIPNNDIGRMTFHARHLERKKKLWWYLGGVSLIFIFSVGIVYGIVYGSWFKVRVIQVEGIRSTQQNALLASLSAQIFQEKKMLSFFGPDHILFWAWSIISSNNELFASLSQPIISANIITKNVVIRVQEPTIYGIWCIEEGKRCYGFDAQGIVFTKTPDVYGSLLIRIDDMNDRVLTQRYPILPRAQWIHTFFTTLESIRQKGVFIEKIVIHDFSLREWEVVTSRGDHIILSLDNIPEGLSEILTRIISDPVMRDVHFFDFRVAHRIYYR